MVKTAMEKKRMTQNSRKVEAGTWFQKECNQSIFFANLRTGLAVGAIYFSICMLAGDKHLSMHYVEAGAAINGFWDYIFPDNEYQYAEETKIIKILLGLIAISFITLLEIIDNKSLFKEHRSAIVVVILTVIIVCLSGILAIFSYKLEDIYPYRILF